jgi:hypothetical protein
MTDKRPQTIQFLLPQGEPRGIRIAIENLLDDIEQFTGIALVMKGGKASGVKA